MSEEAVQFLLHHLRDDASVGKSTHPVTMELLTA